MQHLAVMLFFFFTRVHLESPEMSKFDHMAMASFTLRVGQEWSGLVFFFATGTRGLHECNGTAETGNGLRSAL